MAYKYKHSILGGTFDHLHEGHKFFISEAFERSEKVTIGLATGKLLKHKAFLNSVEKYEIRKEALLLFLNDQFEGRFEITRIEDPYGSSLRYYNIDAIFVTSHGLPNAKKINKKRLENGLGEIEINKVPFLRGKDGKVISSTRIRSGEIDRKGNPYTNIFRDGELILPDDLRGVIENAPKGLLFKDAKELKDFVQKSFFSIVVGDISTSIIFPEIRHSGVFIVDGKVARKPFKNALLSTISVHNRPGTINPAAVLVIKKSINETLKGAKQVIKVGGEEDLLALPATLLAPLGSLVIYGMPGRGAIAARVTETLKNEIYELLKRFSQ